MNRPQAGQSPRFYVLGPLHAQAGETTIALGGSVHHEVLAVLLVAAGRLVTVSRLVDAVWSTSPPATAPHQIRKAVSALRRLIPGGHGVILTVGPGYRLDPDRCWVDLYELTERRSAAARAVADGDLETAVAELQGALSMWRGPALAGLCSESARSAAVAWEEERLVVTEQCFDLRLQLGEGAELVADLRKAVRESPLREALRQQLMLALYRAGRQADALAEYGRFRRELQDELGIEPGPGLVGLHARILRSSPSLIPAGRGGRAAGGDDPPAVADGRPAPPGVSPSAPRGLPATIPDFTGRTKELAALLGMVTLVPASTNAAPVIGIDGMGGVGKSSVAVHAAHLAAGRYPDGCLAVNLRGFCPGEDPLTPSAALLLLLRGIGTPAHAIPADADARRRLWQAAIGSRSMLLILDDARDATQVRPLIPASSACLVIVTSRTRLVDLDGARWLSLGPMPPGESASFVTGVLEAEHARPDPRAAAELAELCGHLPLALRIATARLGNRPTWTIAHLVAKLRDEDRVLDELRSGDRSVRTSLRLSYDALAPRLAESLRVLGLHPAAPVDVHAAAVLFGTTDREAESTLEALVDAHFLQEPLPGRYTLGRLVRVFARELLAEDRRPYRSAPPVGASPPTAGAHGAAPGTTSRR